MKKKILAIIPARGGSESVPKKNIKQLGGIPLIVYTIKEAQKSHFNLKVIVSTDCPETAEIARQQGAEVPFLRPNSLSEGHVQDFPVCEHALSFLEKTDNYIPDIVAWLRPTSPLRKAWQIDEAIKILINNPEADSVRSVCLAPKHPLKMWKIENNRLVPFIEEKVYGIKEAYNYPRQKLPKAYVQNGAFDIFWRRTIIEKRSISGDIIMPYVMDEIYSVNLDTPIDFELAAILMSKVTYLR